MKNNKGFTVVEVAVSFVLVTTVSLVLLQLVLSLKEVYLSGDVKTTLLNKQGIMIKYIYDDLNNKDLSKVETCGLSCLKFTYGDTSVKELLVDPGNKTISYGDYTMQIDNSSYFDKISVSIDAGTDLSSTTDDSILVIDIPIISKLLDEENFGFHIVKTYNHISTTVNITSDISNTRITLSGINSNMIILTGKDDQNNDTIEGLFAKVFHQTSGNNFGNDFNNFIKSSDANKLSSLTSLEAFRMKNDLEDITSSLTDEDKEIYQDGYLSFLLVYNNINLSSGNFARWYQTSNIANKEELQGFYPYENIGNGLTYRSNENYWSSIVGKSTNIGVKSGALYDLDNNVANQVDLYVEAREYVCKYAMSNVTYNGTDIRSLTLYDGTLMCPTNNN